MITQSRIPSFCREDLDEPVTWRTLNEVHIPLSFAYQKILSQAIRQILTFGLSFIPMGLFLAMTFRPFMHGIKPLIYNVEIRANIFVAVVVVSLWLLSRLRYRTSLKRLQFLLHVIPVLWVTLQTVFSWG